MTQVASGSQAANEVRNAALFSESCKQPTFTNLLTGSAPKAVKAGNGSKKQTDKGAPIVRITDLEKEAGDTVTVDIFHELNGLPTMGDNLIEGRSEDISQAHDKIIINQGRKPVDAGGKMTQKRTKQNLRKASRTLLGSYFGRLKDELTLAHIAGARGDFSTAKTILPSDDHPEWEELVTNPVNPPTFNRHFYGGDATAIDNLDASDLFSMDVVDMLALIMAETGNPLQPIMLAGDEMRLHDPFYMLYVTPRQWHDFTQSSTQKDWQQMVSRAMNRSKGFNHTLFKGDMAMHKNILIKPMTHTVRFNTGSDVKVCTNSKGAAIETRNPGVTVERSMLMGAQALAHAFGNVAGKGDGGASGHFSMKEIETDAGNRKQQIIHWMDGMSKIRFKDREGYITDHGVAVIDTAVTSQYMNL